MAECSVLVFLADGVFFNWLEQRSLQAADLGQSPTGSASGHGETREIRTIGVFIKLN